MSRLSKAAARCAIRLVPAERRDWVEALWTEAEQAPPGLTRLAWRADGVRFIAGEARLLRRTAQAVAFAAAVAWIAHVAWPGPASNPATAVNRLTVVTLLPVLSAAPLLARWLLGPAAPGWLARLLRIGAYAAVLVMTLAKAVVEPVADNPAATPYLNPDASTPVKDGMIATWLGQSVFLFIVAGYVAAILALTARRARVAPATLAVGTGTGLVLGAVMYTIFPIGFTKQPTNPLLPGSAADLLVTLGWVLLLGGPVLAGVVAARRYRGSYGPQPASPEQVSKIRMRQGGAAGLLAAGVGALSVSVLGTATVALLPRAGWLLRWLYPGQHLVGSAAYIRELTASVRIGHYGLMLLIFPVIGLLMSAWGVNLTLASMPPDGDGGR
jgi:hypothetical protein